MSYSEDYIGLAAEYVLGTLDNLERVQVETMMTVDSGFRELVAAWETKLGELHGMVAAIEPPVDLWPSIDAIINGREPVPGPITAAAFPELAGGTSPDLQPPASPLTEAVDALAPPPNAVPLPRAAGVFPVPVDTTPAELAERPAGSQEEAGSPVDAVVAEGGPQTQDPLALPSPANDRRTLDYEVRELSGGDSHTGLRIFALTMTAIASALAVYALVSILAPERLPAPLKSKPVVQIVKVEKPRGSEYVGLMQRETIYPGFILTFDGANRALTVRRLMAPVEVGKSYELWIVSDKLGAPRSLGLVGTTDFTLQPAIVDHDDETIRTAVFMITQEAEGGSTTGQPTSSPLFAGRLIEARPAQSN